MRKIPTIFERPWDNPDPRARALVTEAPSPAAEWVFNGVSLPTEKMDGTAVLFAGGNPFKRLEIKKGKTPPPGWFPADEPDPVTGKQVGWIGIIDRDPADRWRIEAVKDAMKRENGLPPDGTYELVGPKIQGNPYDLSEHLLVRHGNRVFPLSYADLTYQSIRGFLERNNIEGIVWHHVDGRMAKIKRRDFGIQWP